MDADTVARVMSLIPERSARLQCGVQFELAASTCRYPERLAHVSKFLHWMSPLDILSNEDQQVLGLRNALGRPVHAADLEDEELDAEEAQEIQQAQPQLQQEPPLQQAQPEREEEPALV